MATHVRRMAEADIEQVSIVQSSAFGGVLADWMQRYHEGPRFTWRDAWVVDVDGEIGAAAVAIPSTWWFNGVAFPVSAIAAVAVGVVYRRRGLASQMMRAILQADQEANRPYSMLYPFQHGFYRRLGYATVGWTHFYRLPVAQLPDAPALRHKVRLLHSTDYEAVYDLYRQSLLSGPGGLDRNAGQWIKRWTRKEEQWVVYDDGAIQGYLAYQRVENQLDVRELVATTSDAERGLWAFLAAQIEQIRAVTFHAPTDRPLWAMLREPLMFEAANRGFVLNDAAALTASLMLRTVNVPNVLAWLAVDPQIHGEIRLALQDTILPNNQATWAISFNDGQASATATDAPPTASCDMVTFTQLCCGALRARDARWQGLLQADDATTTLLDHAFRGPTPYIAPADWF